MRIEFYRVSTDPSKLQWDITHANYSAITEKKSRAYTSVDHEILCSEGGFFLDPTRLSSKEFPKVPATQKDILNWLIRAGFFSPLWIIKILLGNEETLYQACTALKDRFPNSLRVLLSKRGHSPIEKYLGELRSTGAEERFKDMARIQSAEIAMYKSKGVPRMVDSN